MRSEAAVRRVLRAGSFLTGQAVVLFILVVMAGFFFNEGDGVDFPFQFALFAVSVYYLGFLIGPMVLFALVFWDNRGWVRLVSALLPVGVAAASCLATVLAQRDGEIMLLFQDGALLGITWLVLTVATLIAYNRLFQFIERRFDN